MHAENAPFIIAVLNEHLGKDQRKRPVNELVNLVEADIEDIRFAHIPGLELKRSAQAYCEQWRQAGFLLRKPAVQHRQETYELSAGAMTAISFAKNLLEPQRSATQNRLSLILGQINDLALALDQNEDRRREALLAQRANIDAQLQAINQGNMEIIDEAHALEQLSDILALAQGIPEDFARVRSDFEQINKHLHETIINCDAGSANILEDIFSGVDEIGQSPSGQAFKGFYALLRDAGLTEELQDNIVDILDNPITKTLSSEQRSFLRNLIRMFHEESQEVHSVMTSFARSLRRFVQNQNFLADRALKQEINHALGRAHRALETHPVGYSLNTELNLTGVELRSVSRLHLFHPEDNQAAPIYTQQTQEAEPVSLELLREAARETEIDFHEISDNVNQLLENLAPGEAFPSPASVLAAYPASQGVATVVGLIVLASTQGRYAGGTECVQWTSRNKTKRSAIVDKFEFFQEVRL